MNRLDIIKKIVNYLYDTNPVAKDAAPLPLDESLLEAGILDSFAVVELVSHVEKEWKIEISNHDLTKERFGSIEKMANVVQEKLQQRDGSKKG